MSETTKKANKLASAVYLLTSFFSDQEPLKWKLRNLSTDFVSLSMSLNSYLFEDREFAGLENRKIVTEIMSLLDMAKNVGLISDGNYTLLSQEFSKYLDSIGYPAGLEERGGRAVLSEKFFAPSPSVLPVPLSTPEIPVKDKTISELPDAPTQKPVSEYLPPIKIDKTVTLEEEIKDKPLKQFGAVSVKKNSRQSVIIGLLKRKKEIMIKDVSPLISGCSEKTIQRELSAMVAAGILRKMGEKRWSRYTLA